MDTINFNIEKVNNNFNIIVYINEKKLDEKVFNLFESIIAFDLHKIEFNLFTCGCGYPECAGFFNEIFQIKNDKNVQWLIPKEYNTEKNLYIFNTNDFNEKIKKLKEDVFLLINNKSIPLCAIDDSYEEYNDEEYKNNREINIVKIIENTTKYLKEKEKIFNLIDDYSIFYNSVKISYYNYELNVKKYDLIFAILNEYPSLNIDKSYKERVIKATNALNKWIFNNDFSEVKEIDNKAYEEIYNNEFTNIDDMSSTKNTEMKHLYSLNRFYFINKFNNQMRLVFDSEHMYFNEEKENYIPNFSLNHLRILI